MNRHSKISYLIILVIFISLTSCSSVQSVIPRPSSSQIADISAHIYITDKLFMSSNQGYITPTNSGSFFWVADILIKNKGYSPGFVAINYWIISLSDDGGGVVCAQILKDKNSQINIKTGENGQFTTFFQIPKNITTKNAQLVYRAQPLSTFYCPIVGSDVYESYDLDANKPIGSPVPFVPTTSTQDQPPPSSNAPQFNMQSHTGFVKMTSTGNNQTTIIFQDGFIVQFAGSMKMELLPAIGEKIEIRYVYDQKAGGNVLTYLQDVK